MKNIEKKERIKRMKPEDIKILEKIQSDYVVYDGHYPYTTKEWCVLDKVIKELKKETTSRESYEHEYSLRKRFETEILRLESIINNQWISVEENLPEEYHAVLVYCPQQKNIYCTFRDKNEWRIFGELDNKIELEVVAWRPLPTHPPYNLCDTNPFNDERFDG